MNLDDLCANTPKKLYHVYDNCIHVLTTEGKVWKDNNGSHLVMTKAGYGWYLFIKRDKPAAVFSSYWEARAYAMKNFDHFSVWKTGEGK